MVGYESVECCLCKYTCKRYEMPKHLKWVHGWTEECSLGYVIPGWVGRVVPAGRRN